MRMLKLMNVTMMLTNSENSLKEIKYIFKDIYQIYIQQNEISKSSLISEKIRQNFTNAYNSFLYATYNVNMLIVYIK